MNRPRKARVEGATAGEHGDVAAIKAGIDAFKARFPDQWEAIRLGPTQHGIDQIIEALGG